MPEEAIQRWMIKGATPAENFTSDSVKTYLNWQGTAEKGLDCAMYHFTLGNRKQIFIRGDIYHREGFLGCMDFIKKNSLGIDYVFATHYFTSGEAPIPYLDARFRCRFIPIHEWEFSHRPADTPGTATQCFAELQSVYAEPYAAGRAQFLTWGESIGLD